MAKYNGRDVSVPVGEVVLHLSDIVVTQPDGTNSRVNPTQLILNKDERSAIFKKLHEDLDAIEKSQADREADLKKQEKANQAKP